MFRWTAGTKARADRAARRHGVGDGSSRLLLASRPLRTAPPTLSDRPPTVTQVGNGRQVLSPQVTGVVSETSDAVSASQAAPATAAAVEAGESNEVAAVVGAVDVVELQAVEAPSAVSEGVEAKTATVAVPESALSRASSCTPSRTAADVVRCQADAAATDRRGADALSTCCSPSSSPASHAPPEASSASSAVTPQSGTCVASSLTQAERLVLAMRAATTHAAAAAAAGGRHSQQQQQRRRRRGSGHRGHGTHDLNGSRGRPRYEDGNGRGADGSGANRRTVSSSSPSSSSLHPPLTRGYRACSSGQPSASSADSESNAHSWTEEGQLPRGVGERTRRRAMGDGAAGPTRRHLESSERRRYSRVAPVYTAAPHRTRSHLRSNASAVSSPPSAVSVDCVSVQLPLRGGLNTSAHHHPSMSVPRVGRDVVVEDIATSSRAAHTPPPASLSAASNAWCPTRCVRDGEGGALPYDAALFCEEGCAPAAPAALAYAFPPERSTHLDKDERPPWSGGDGGQPASTSLPPGFFCDTGDCLLGYTEGQHGACFTFPESAQWGVPEAVSSSSPWEVAPLLDGEQQPLPPAASEGWNALPPLAAPLPWEEEGEEQTEARGAAPAFFPFAYRPEADVTGGAAPQGFQWEAPMPHALPRPHAAPPLSLSSGGCSGEAVPLWAPATWSSGSIFHGGAPPTIAARPPPLSHPEMAFAAPAPVPFVPPLPGRDGHAPYAYGVPSAVPPSERPGSVVPWPTSRQATQQRGQRGGRRRAAPRALNGMTERCRRFWERCRHPPDAMPPGHPFDLSR